MRFHHVNLGVPTGGIDAQASFLVDVLGYRVVDVDDDLRARGVNWFEADDGSQVHLSEDAEHRPAARAHVAVDYGDGLAAVGHRLERAGWKFAASDGLGARTLLCKDPSGNRWELRGRP